MITLSNASHDEIAQFGHNLFYSQGSNLQSFEEAAQLCTQSIFKTFRETDSQSTFALVRIYRLCQTDELSSDLIESLNNTSNVTDSWLTLMGTTGDESDWCNRQLSQKHKAVPINDDLSLMFKAIFNQLRLAPQEFDDDIPVEIGKSTIPMVKYFYVSDAHTNPSIPDKDDFVIPYDIQSVIGIGSPFLSGSFYIGLFFSKVFLSRDDVETFTQLATSVSTLLATYDSNDHIWDK